MQSKLLDRLSDAAVALMTGMRTVRCPHPGCIVHIRYRCVTPDEARHLTDLATDHTRHEATK